MVLNNKTILISILLICFKIGYSQSPSPNDWYQFRGADRNGISKEDLSEINWIDCKPELIWKKEIGSGFSEVLISNGIIYTMDSKKTDSLHGLEYIIALKEETGEEIWRAKVDSIYIDEDSWGDGPRSTPVIDDHNIYSFSGHGKLNANSKKDGSLLWQIDFKKEFGSTTPRWGFASSPVLVDDVLIMEAGGTDSMAFMGFNKTTGKIIWSYGVGNASHDSPLLTTIEGTKQIIFANGRTLYSLLPTGDTLWTFKMPFGGVTAMPVLIDKNQIFVSRVTNPGFFVVEIKNNKANEILRGTSMKNDYSSCVYHNGFIYGYNVAAVRCISAETGEVSWSKRGFGKGSLMLVNSKLFILSDKGKLAIVEATPEAYTELTSVQTITGKSWTAPSFNNGKVYLRNLSEIACYKIK